MKVTFTVHQRILQNLVVTCILLKSSPDSSCLYSLHMLNIWGVGKHEFDSDFLWKRDSSRMDMGCLGFHHNVTNFCTHFSLVRDERFSHKLETQKGPAIITESQNHSDWKRPLQIIQSNPLLKQALYSIPRWALNISRAGDSTTSVHSLFQFSVHMNSCSYRTSCVPVCAHCPLFRHWAPPKGAIWLPTLSSRLNSPRSQPFLRREMLQALFISVAHHWLFPVVPCLFELGSPELDTVLQIWPH